MITQVHLDSNGTYGALRVHAELTMGRGITVGHNAVAMLMRRAELHGLPGARRRRSRHQPPTASDLVERQFTRTEPNQLWVTDITEHPTREGKVYCSVVLDVFSRRVVGWSIDSTPTATLVTNALGMAIENRRPSAGAAIAGSFWGRMQVELLNRRRWQTRMELANAIFENPIEFEKMHNYPSEVA